MLICADIFSYKDKIAFGGIVRDPDGIGRVGQLIKMATQNDPPAVLGRLLRELIEYSQEVSVAEDTLLLPKALGARSWSQIDNESLCCLVEWTDMTITLTPSRRESEGGHSFKSNKALTVDRQASVSALGKAIVTALERCT